MAARAWFAAAAWTLASGAGAMDLPVANPGFEEAADDAGRAPGWHSASGAGALAVDETLAHSGRRSLRLEFQPPFTGSAQVLDAVPYRGKKVVLQAMLRGPGLAPGTSGLWIRADTVVGEVVGFQHSYRQPVDGGPDWVRHEIALAIPDSASQLMFGAAAGAAGTLWIDDVVLSAAGSETPPAEAAALTYLEQALDLIQKHAYYRDRVDWPALRASSRELLRDATRPGDTYPAIRQALAALGDNHSHLVTPGDTAHHRSEETRADYGIESAALGPIGYVRVPGFTGIGQAPGTAFASQIRAALRGQADRGACGWIVDLRGNMGGNMHPMLAGLRDLLGDGELGFFVGREGRAPWRAMGGDTPRLTRAPVAVLADGRTASSGEAVLLSFVGRPDTRSFGSPTFGVSTVNRAMPLPDGATLALTVAVQADRTGRTYGAAIAPEQRVASADTPGELADDPVAQAARDWLLAQPACRSNARLE